ncbi:MAG: hypothetical protein ACKOU6_15325 [Planctomycetota bacterium]
MPTRLRQLHTSSIRRGTTLLELILALALSVLLLGAIALAIRFNLRALDSRRADVEEAQLARAVLRMITDDLHSAVQHEVVDFKPLEDIATSALSAQVSNAANALSSAASSATSGASSSGGAATGGGSSPGGSSSANNSKGGGASGGGSSGSSSSTGKTGGTGGGASTGGSSSGGASTGGASSGGASSGGASTGGASSSGASSGSPSTSDPSANTTDIASTAVPPPIPGLYGNQYELQLDVSRLPRLDQYQSMTGSAGTLSDIPSAVKTVAYYLRGANQAAPDTGFAAAGALSQQDAARPGLVRRQLDRAVSMQAASSGNSSLNQLGELIAPEVVSIEFRYSDGSQWLTEWDSSQMQGLPVAVEILVALQPSLAYADPNDTSTIAKKAVSQSPKMYRHVVRLPAGKIPAATDGTTTDGSESSSSSGSAASGSGSTGSGSAGSGSTGGP